MQFQHFGPRQASKIMPPKPQLAIVDFAFQNLKTTNMHLSPNTIKTNKNQTIWILARFLQQKSTCVICARLTQLGAQRRP